MTTLTAVEKTPIDYEAETWDARAEFDVGTLILRYLAESPPPDGARFYEDFDKWGTNLVARGSERLEDLGVSPLRSVGGDA